MFPRPAPIIAALILSNAVVAEDGIPQCCLGCQCPHKLIEPTTKDPIGLGIAFLALEQTDAEPGRFHVSSVSDEKEPIVDIVVEAEVWGDHELVGSLEMTNNIMDRGSVGWIELIADLSNGEVEVMLDSIVEDRAMERLMEWMLGEILPEVARQSSSSAIDSVVADIDPADGFLCTTACLFACDNPAPSGESCLEYCIRICRSFATPP